MILVTTPGNVGHEATRLLAHEHQAVRLLARNPDKVARLRAGLPAAVAEMNAQAFGLIAHGDAEWISDDIANILGRDPRSFEQFARDHANAFTPAATTGA